MSQDLPPQQPEGKLIQDALTAKGQSIRQIAPLAGMSDARWRQIVKGYMHVSGVVTPSIAPATTLARMAQVVDVTEEQLTAAGRPDAAAALAELNKRVSPPAATFVATGTAEVGSTAARPTVVDEIDLIYASTSMTPQEKLNAIRMVLRLRAEMDAEATEPAPAKDPVDNH